MCVEVPRVNRFSRRLCLWSADHGPPCKSRDGASWCWGSGNHLYLGAQHGTLGRRIGEARSGCWLNWDGAVVGRMNGFGMLGGIRVMVYVWLYLVRRVKTF